MSRTIKYRTYSLVGIVVVALLISLYGGVFTRQKAEAVVLNKPKHIIIIDICSLRADHMSAYGYGRKTTPNLEEFAKEAAMFSNFWTESGWCLPNLTTLLTGTRPDVHQMTYINTKLSPSITTLAEILTDNGFATAGFSGSRYLVPKTYGLEKGFQRFVDPFTSEDNVMGSVSYHTNEAAVQKWLNENKDKPFFLFLTIDDLHSPYTHADNPKLFDPEYKGILDTMDADLLFDRAYNGENLDTLDQKKVAAAEEFKKDPKNLEHLIARYDAAVVHVDTMVGELLQSLKDRGLWDDSMIIITAHQGEQLGEHGKLGHVSGVYEPILHVPLFIHYPGAAANGATVPALTERIDIPSTILDSLGLLEKYKRQYSGTSLLPLLDDADNDGKEYIYASSKPVWTPTTGEPSIEERAVRNNRYKLIWYGYKDAKYELYDLKKDPKETTNLINRLPYMAGRLKVELDSFVQTAVNK